MKQLVLSTALVLSPALVAAQPGQVVAQQGAPQQGNTTPWSSIVQGKATAEVTRTYACGLAANGACAGGYGQVGSGSLQLSVTGQGNTSSGYPDWGFYYRYAGGTLQQTLDKAASFGDLTSLTSLSFDWFRASLPGWDAPVGAISDLNGQPVNPADWAYKTPVVRLQLLETRNGVSTISELVWEGYYNKCKLGASSNCDLNKTVVDTWQRQQNMQDDNFWYVRPPAQISGNGLYSQGSACNSPMSFWAGGVNALNRNNLFSSTGCLFGATVKVIGIAVGVGSQWPMPWEGAVDNVRMAFGGTTVLDANFDWVDPQTPNTAVPEPSSWALLAMGLVGLTVAHRRRRTPR